MTFTLSVWDWVVIAVYIIGLIGFAIVLSRGQNTQEAYYVGARSIGPWPIAISIMATQCSTNSILGAPAFVGFAPGGGLLWLQYELAVPLAMLVLIVVFVPTFKAFQWVSVYQFLESRFDRQTRLFVSGLFLFVRAFATAVTVYSIALVVDLITGVGFFWAVMLLGAITVIYDVLGGMRGVVYSDVIQMVILVAMLVVLLISLILDAGGWQSMLTQVDLERRATVDFLHHGLGDGHTFAFWPMLFGGWFLYVAYYGCDQSQMQRVLSTADVPSASKALWLNGLMRFPLVALYCFIGLGLAAYASITPAFLAGLPQNEGVPQLNLVVPAYMMQVLPVGVLGLGMVALFAAAMSSLDSVINSMSATTMEDFIRPYVGWIDSDRKALLVAQGVTVFWGVLTLGLAFTVGDIAPTVLEAINKVGSLANGPILAVFLAGLLLKPVSAGGIKAGVGLGLLANLVCWRYWSSVSWLWWNVLGCMVTLGVALAMASKGSAKALLVAPKLQGVVQFYPISLCVMFCVMLLALLWLGSI